MSRSLIGKGLTLLSAALILTLIVIGAVSEVGPDGQGVTPSASPTNTGRSPQHAGLLRCQSLGETAIKDKACLALWAEARRRFLTPALTSGEGD
jgi:conjugative transfer region protein TrbK